MRFPEIDGLKGLAIIGVLLAHMKFTTDRLNTTTIETIEILQFLFGWCVIAFFFASGLIQKPITSWREFTEYLKKRFRRLIIPCIVFSLSYRFILIGIHFSGLFSWSPLLPDNFFAVLQFLIIPVGPQFYFLPYLFFISIFIAFLELFISRKLIFTTAVLIVPALYFFITTPAFPYGSSPSLVPIYTFSYILGVIFSRRKVEDDFGEKIVWLLSIFSLFAFLIIGNNSIVFIHIYIPLFLWLLFLRFPTIPLHINNTKLGDNSGGIYVWHAPIVLPFVSIVCTRFFTGKVFVILPMLIGTILISVILTKLTNKYSLLRPWRF